MSFNLQHIIRVDLLGLYETLERYTSLRARLHVDSDENLVSNMVINESDFHTVNPLIRLSFAKLSDDLGTLDDIRYNGLDALSKYGLEDYKTKFAGGGEEMDMKYIMAHYNLPGETQHGYVSAYHEFIYEALASDVLRRWFRHLGMFDISQIYEQEYKSNLKQARNAGPRWASAPKHRRAVNL